MKHRKSFLCLFAIIILMITITSSNGAIPPAERAALIALYDNTGGDSWTDKTNWNGPSGTEDTWYGITVISDHVTSILLGLNNLIGTIPAELGSLTNLEYIELGDNQLIGGIPPVLGKLTNLTNLRLDGNQLTGGIPPELGNSTNLNYVHLANNQLTGGIPSELGNLTNLGYIFLFDNQLSGSIPPEFGLLNNLKVLHLAGNQLTGGIPPELGKLTNLKELYLHDNQLFGSIPDTLTGLTNLYDCESSPWGSSGLRIYNNHLYTNNPTTKAFVDLKACPNWEDTQSVTVVYVSKNGNCYGKLPCYTTIQAAINTVGQWIAIIVSQGEYFEVPVKSNAGTVSIAGGWNETFTEQTGTTVMYAPHATAGGIIKVLPNFQMVAPQ